MHQPEGHKNIAEAVPCIAYGKSVSPVVGVGVKTSHSDCVTGILMTLLAALSDLKLCALRPTGRASFMAPSNPGPRAAISRKVRSGSKRNLLLSIRSSKRPKVCNFSNYGKLDVHARSRPHRWGTRKTFVPRKRSRRLHHYDSSRNRWRISRWMDRPAVGVGKHHGPIRFPQHWSFRCRRDLTAVDLSFAAESVSFSIIQIRPWLCGGSAHFCTEELNDASFCHRSA